MSWRGCRLHVLGGHVPFEDVLEVTREREVDVVEVRHVDHVVDDLAAVRALDEQRIPGPVGPFRGAESLDLGNRHVGGRRVALRVVPDVELPVALDGRPGPGPRQRRDTSRVRDSRALAVAAPAPVVERTRDGITLHGAVRQVATHVTAVGVEHTEGPVGRLEHHQRRAERIDLMRGAVLEVFARPRQCHPRAKRVGADPTSIIRTSSPSTALLRAMSTSASLYVKNTLGVWCSS